MGQDEPECLVKVTGSCMGKRVQRGNCLKQFPPETCSSHAWLHDAQTMESFHDYDMPFCPGCGSQMGGLDKFCRSCGNNVSQQQATPTLQQQPSPAAQSAVEVQDLNLNGNSTESEIVSDTSSSRLSMAGVEKFLGPGERLLYSTVHRVRSPGGARYGYVTNKRVLFYIQDGKLFKRDKLEEWSLNHIRKLRIVEKGMVMKSLYLEIEDMRVQGDREDLLELYKKIQALRA